MKKIIKIISIISFLLTILTVTTDSQFAYIPYGINYYVDNFKINVKVNENKTLDVEEKIGVVFYNSNSNFVRRIPKERYEKISNIVISDDYSYDISEENDVVIITINSGKKEYLNQNYFTISYTYNYGKDIEIKKDSLEFYFVDQLWDVSVSNVYFRIQMPYDIDESIVKLKFDVQDGNPAFNLDEEVVSYSIDGNIISGNLNGLLDPKQYFKISMDLPNNYFKNEDIIIDTPTVLIWVVPILCLFLSLLTIREKKKHEDDLAEEDSLDQRKRGKT